MVRRALVAALLGIVVFAVPANSAFVVKATRNASGADVFKPKKALVAPGTKVTWKAVKGTHDVTSIGKKWSKYTIIPQGSKTSYTFKKAGKYRYRCMMHSSYNPSTKVCTGMCGKVIVR
jgi:plastocyanin